MIAQLLGEQVELVVLIVRMLVDQTHDVLSVCARRESSRFAQKLRGRGPPPPSQLFRGFVSQPIDEGTELLVGEIHNLLALGRMEKGPPTLQVPSVLSFDGAVEETRRRGRLHRRAAHNGALVDNGAPGGDRRYEAPKACATTQYDRSPRCACDRA